MTLDFSEYSMKCEIINLSKDACLIKSKSGKLDLATLTFFVALYYSWIYQSIDWDLLRLNSPTMHAQIGLKLFIPTIYLLWRLGNYGSRTLLANRIDGLLISNSTNFEKSWAHIALQSIQACDVRRLATGKGGLIYDVEISFRDGRNFILECNTKNESFEIAKLISATLDLAPPKLTQKKMKWSINFIACKSRSELPSSFDEVRDLSVLQSHTTNQMSSRNA